MGRLCDCYAFVCGACGKDVEVPVHATGERLRCPLCGATFAYNPRADESDPPDSVRAEQAWGGRELTADQAVMMPVDARQEQAVSNGA
ncbi:MAG: hypothetical protein IT168_05930 [Bryobacterales bacterium]|nr:hypothetical protein [Bryobacterales bacterium]